MRKSACVPVLLILLITVLGGAEELSLNSFRLDDIVIYHHPRDERLISNLSRQLAGDIDAFRRTVSYYDDIEVRLVVAPDDAFYMRLVAGYEGVIEFSEAFYSGGTKTIYIRNPAHLKDFSRLRTIILHEYIHLFVDTIYRDAPLWFHEGMAVFFSEGVSYDRQLLFASDFLRGNSLPLTQMVANYPPNRVQWQSFYTKSALAVKFLYNRYSEEFFRLWQRSDDEQSFRQAFIETFMMTPEMFALRFEEHLSRKYKIEMLISFSSLIWGLLPLILFIGWVRKKIIARRIQKKWDREIEAQSY